LFRKRSPSRFLSPAPTHTSTLSLHDALPIFQVNDHAPLVALVLPLRPQRDVRVRNLLLVAGLLVLAPHLKAGLLQDRAAFLRIMLTDLGKLDRAAGLGDTARHRAH